MQLRPLASTNDTFSLPSVHEHALHGKFTASSQYTYPQLQPPPPHTTSRPIITTQLSWLHDSSALLTVSSDNCIRNYIPPPSLLQDPVDQVVPYTRSYLPWISTSCVHPQASIYKGSIPMMISGKEVPLKLYDAYPDSRGRLRVLRTFNTAHPQTEKFAKISCITFLNESTVISGSMKSIQMFDIERSDPLGEISTQGIVSAMAAMQSEFVSEAWVCGTWNGAVSVFSHDGEPVMTTKCDGGVFQLLESGNGKYVYAVPRNGDSIRVLDIRMGLEEVCSLGSFNSESQRISGTLKSNSQGLIIGTADGSMNWYKDAEMGLSTVESLKLSETSVSHTSIHSQEPNVIAFSTGDRDCKDPQVTMAWIDS